ncbi:Protein CBG06218 [Caenorhabditis briggsae]|uniref:Protein CBG06218 n=1 Tax=Caenorhabditis briggsae TaxID=6238 RepID=A8X0M3_CAEBR|nr:Protein CBG06218 [Caenorhabditis briggsae]CAP26183.1 Protein CBG06218 [Caenorhabditis briggsae]
MAQAEDVEPETYQIMRTIENSLMNNDNVDLEQYLLFWEHVCKVMGSWGTVFGFVVKDVTAKIEKLAAMRVADPESYRSIQTMARKESTDGTIRNLKPNRSGTGHLMVLNRALEFVIDMLDGVFTSDDASLKVSTPARCSYDKHLSQFHSWPIRTAVSAALYTLPRKTEFLIRLRGSMPESEDGQFHDVFNRDGRDIVRRVNQLVENFDLVNHNPSA